MTKGADSGSTERRGKPAARLVVWRGGIKGREYQIQEGNNLVGRWDPDSGAFPEIDLEADDEEAKVSRKHAVIERRGQKVTVEDLGSLNGTYINRGARLKPGTQYPLQPGDELIVGKTFLRFEVES
jgi:pSer/pThr/pTyr-binding forkhead associated (FHA) protein